MKKFYLGFFLLLPLILSVGCSSSEKAEKPYIPPVSQAAASAEPIKQSEETQELQEAHLIIDSMPAKYTYEDLLQDIAQLQNAHGTSLHVTKLCDTADGRGVYDLVVGDPQGENQILVFGAMHAREYITSQVVMRQLCGVLNALGGYGGEYQGIPEKELLENVTLHFIPISNPDGVAISQFGLDGVQSDALRQNVATMGYGDYAQWKANANGVDLNRNFDADWAEFVGSSRPSSERYKGSFPGSEPEAAALIQLTQQYRMKRTISYHTCGALIYWYFKQQGEVLEQSRRFAERISRETGYPLDSDYTAVDAAGYKDWAVYRMGIPSLTIEVGDEYGYGINSPVPISAFPGIWERNQNVIYATVCNLKYES